MRVVAAWAALNVVLSLFGFQIGQDKFSDFHVPSEEEFGRVLDTPDIVKGHHAAQAEASCMRGDLPCLFGSKSHFHFGDESSGIIAFAKNGLWNWQANFPRERNNSHGSKSLPQDSWRFSDIPELKDGIRHSWGNGIIFVEIFGEEIPSSLDQKIKISTRKDFRVDMSTFKKREDGNSFFGSSSATLRGFGRYGGEEKREHDTHCADDPDNECVPGPIRAPFRLVSRLPFYAKIVLFAAFGAVAGIGPGIAAWRIGYCGCRDGWFWLLGILAIPLGAILAVYGN